jgi:hypothetical protein
LVLGGKSKIVKTNQLKNLGGFLWVEEWRNKFFTFFKKDAVTRFDNLGLEKIEDYRSIGFYCFDANGDSMPL